MADTDIKVLQEDTRKNAEALDANAKALEKLGGVVEGLEKHLRTTSPHPHPHQVLGAPWVRDGEDPLSSRGFSFLKMIGVMSGAIDVKDAKIEIDVHNRMNQAFQKEYPYEWGGLGHVGVSKFVAPLATNFFHDSIIDKSFASEMKQLVQAGTDGATTGSQRHIAYKMLNSPDADVRTKALSWLNETEGGSLVAPPEMGELIELLRNKEALVNAGARVVPLPPQGRLKFPRQTSASTTYWVGENAAITESDVGTGEVNLQAKKLAVLIKAPNELIRFASPAAEALLRDDMTKQLALGLDLAGLEGSGTDTQPRGIINTDGIQSVTSSSTGANGDTLVAEDVYRCIAQVEEANAEFQTWIMRPKTFYKFHQLRADAVAQGDSSGLFLFNPIREAGYGASAMLADYPVVKSNQVSQKRSKGSRSDLTYILGGMFEDLLIGMFGAIEFAQTTQGDTSFVNDQTWVRGILSADIQPRHAAAFVLLDNLIVGQQP